LTLTSLLTSPPKVHDWGGGELTSTGLPTPVFEFMNKILTPESQTMETGIGISTAVFSLIGCQHTCVGPDFDEIRRLKEYCFDKDISTDNINFICKKSHEVWCDLKENSWDLILIDGLHGFPTPFMDWYFFSQRLKVNGYLVIDDTHIFTGKILKEFLLNEDSWKMVAPITDKTVIFQKIKDFDYNKEFINQPYILKETVAINKYRKYRNFAGTVKRKLVKAFH
jgi:hypothetical protein